MPMADACNEGCALEFLNQKGPILEQVIRVASKAEGDIQVEGGVHADGGERVRKVAVKVPDHCIARESLQLNKHS